MGLLTVANFKTMRYPAKANTFGLMAKCMTGNGKKIKCMARDCLSGEMARGMKDNSLMIKEKAEGRLSGKMEGGMRVTGVKVNSMEWAFLRAKIIKLRGESGSMAGRLGGLKEID